MGLAASSIGAVLAHEEIVDVQTLSAFQVAKTLEQVSYLPTLFRVEPVEFDHEDLRKPLRTKHKK